MSRRDLPSNDKDFARKREGFFTFLRERGSEVRVVSNPYELARFTTPKGVGVIYRNEAGRITSWVNGAREAYAAFLSGADWRGGAKQKRSRSNAKIAHQIKTLIERDGNVCWYCGHPFAEQGPKQRTREHLVSITQKGPDNLANQVLAHQDCNLEAENLSVAEKVRIREQKHAAPQARAA